DCWSTPREHGPQREWPGIAGRTRGPSDTGPSRPGQLVDAAGLRAWVEFPGTAGRHHGILDPGLSPPGQLVDPA
ncbi:hypothetical protein C0215_19170, partial [Clostridioides difficile]